MLITLFPQRMKLFYKVFVVLAFVGSFAHQTDAKVTFSSLERKIIQWTDERHNADSVVLYLTHKDPSVAWRAAWALANMEDSSARSKLIQAIAKEERPVPLDGMAFALGVLGQSKQSYQTLMSVAKKYPTDDVFRAIGRTVPKEEVSALYSATVKLLEARKVSDQTATILIIELSLRKLMTDDYCRLATQLASANDTRTRWQAIYAFSRTEDSALLYRYIPAIAEAIGDAGSPEVRMFAANALGRIHNDSAGKLLIRAARSEQEWRVKVSIFNALTRMPRMNSNILEIIRKTVDAVSTESLLSEHTANAALMTLDAMTAAGKLSLSDSSTVRDWLHTFKTENELYPLMPLRIRAQAMITLSRLEKSIEVYRGMTDIYTYRQKGASTIVTQAFGVSKDTLCFKQLLMRLLQSPESEMHPSLEALNASWQLAKKDSVYMNELTEEKLSGAYRKLLIRLPSQFVDPAIVTTALEYIQDSSIITDSTLRIEANDYISQYIERFSSKEFSDQLQSTLQAIRWLKPSGTDIIIKVRKLYERACTEWSDKALADSARLTLKVLGSDVEKPLMVSIRKTNINWELLENSPDTILVQYAPEFMFIKLDKYNAPMTCLNMIKLFAENYFAQNYFHRVVPNFVIQGGDRTATGFGGPGYSIRREISNVYYDEIGVVGMASSGKDTEGSQWFATHVPTPHLNSRYTIWGKIVQGFGALNTIQRYDKIDNIIPYQ